jgi:hypothetical protein
VSKKSDAARLLSSLRKRKSGGRQGRPKPDVPRCPCGLMTLARATARCHRCSAPSAVPKKGLTTQQALSFVDEFCSLLRKHGLRVVSPTDQIAVVDRRGKVTQIPAPQAAPQPDELVKPSPAPAV